jgi:hypothetical protein
MTIVARLAARHADVAAAVRASHKARIAGQLATVAAGAHALGAERRVAARAAAHFVPFDGGVTVPAAGQVPIVERDERAAGAVGVQQVAHEQEEVEDAARAGRRPHRLPAFPFAK